MANDPTKVTIGEARLSYCHIFEPQTAKDGGNPKYSVALIIPKSNTACLNNIKAALAAAKEAGTATFGGKVGKIDSPIHDGDEERSEDPAYSGCFYLNAKSSRKPGIYTLGPIVNGQRTFTPVTDAEAVYSGCYAFASVRFYAYNNSGHKGIAAALDNVIKVKDGERLGGSAEAPEVAFQGVDFGSYENKSDDFDDIF